MANRVQDVLRKLDLIAADGDGGDSDIVRDTADAAAIIREQQADIAKYERVFGALSNMLEAALAEPRLTHDFVRGLTATARAALRDSEKPNG